MIRTCTCCLSFGIFLRGILLGSKSGGKYYEQTSERGSMTSETEVTKRDTPAPSTKAGCGEGGDLLCSALCVPTWCLFK